MQKIKNIEAYIERKIQKELEKSLTGIIDRRLKHLKLSTIINRHQSNTINDFSRATIKAGINQLQNFGITDAQFMTMFAGEVRRALIRNL